MQTLCGKHLPSPGEFGESWEVSAHPHHVSRVAEGPWRGSLLTELCNEHATALFGNKVPAGRRFPLLVKLLDCNSQLSVQVHPNDELARRLLGEANGKTEAWVVLAAEAGGRIYAGLLPGTTRTDLEAHLADQTVAMCLYSFAPKPGDCVLLRAGTVHAVGGGVVLAEVQQSSDATFRLFDWNRLGPEGKSRPLHVADALASIDWNAGPTGPVVPEPAKGPDPSVNREHLVGCPYFQMDRFSLDRAMDMPFAGELSIWMILDGTAELQSSPARYRRTFRRCETVVVPASASPLTWRLVAPSGPATLLGVRLP